VDVIGAGDAFGRRERLTDKIIFSCPNDLIEELRSLSKMLQGLYSFLGSQTRKRLRCKVQIVNRKLTYVLITPARNEADFIEKTLLSVIVQTILPLKWVIVSDGSTDGTDDIVKRYATEHQWIELVRMPERKERHFAGKVFAFNQGYARVKELDYDMIGSLDADISFDPEYFEFLLGKFAKDPQLGLAGTPFSEETVKYDFRVTRKEHVSGACQLFKRACFEDVGGYVPLKAGAIDLVAVVTARMRGWKTETFTDKISVHHRRMGTAKHNVLVSMFRDGYYDYPMGVHPLWEIFRTIYHLSKKPIILGGLLHMTGYFWALLRRTPTLVSREFVRFRRKEQMKWLNEHFKRIMPAHR
jgi:poly-beta-1,6-N-acetyl-D-glucosamine synthase